MKPRQSIGDNLRKMKGVDNGLSCVLFALYREEALAESLAVLRQRNIPISKVYCTESDSITPFDTSGSGRIALDSLLLREARPA
jgi:hypothetical protein